MITKVEIATLEKHLHWARSLNIGTYAYTYGPTLAELYKELENIQQGKYTSPIDTKLKIPVTHYKWKNNKPELTTDGKAALAITKEGASLYRKAQAYITQCVRLLPKDLEKASSIDATVTKFHNTKYEVFRYTDFIFRINWGWWEVAGDFYHDDHANKFSLAQLRVGLFPKLTPQTAHTLNVDYTLSDLTGVKVLAFYSLNSFKRTMDLQKYITTLQQNKLIKSAAVLHELTKETEEDE